MIFMVKNQTGISFKTIMLKQFIAFSLVLIFPACRSADMKNRELISKPGFSYFEFSYLGGMGGGHSFLTDSNRIFFFPPVYPQINGGIIKYGILPDSISKAIDSTIPQIRKLHSLNPDSTYCYDCTEVSIKLISNNDTIRLYQAGGIDSTVWSLIERIEVLRKNENLSYLNAIYFYLETAKDVSSSMPPKIPFTKKRN
jgi:hypothetical protein